jgi:uncharacterized membrane protein (DUF373 family)
VTPPDRPDPLARLGDRALLVAENVVYVLVGLLLATSSLVVLVATAYHLARDLDDGAVHAVAGALDGLLLVFILLELLACVRATMVERRLVAEPFLVVGIIASIKEIVVVALEADREGPQQAFENAMLEIGVLGGLVLVLALAAFLVRRKEREPTEADGQQ